MNEAKNSMIKNIVNFIGKDTSSKNESKKVIVIIRILIISCFFYFTANAILCNSAFGNMRGLVLYGIFLLLFVCIFAISLYFLIYFAQKSLFFSHLYNDLQSYKQWISIH